MIDTVRVGLKIYYTSLDGRTVVSLIRSCFEPATVTAIDQYDNGCTTSDAIVARARRSLSNII